MQTPPADAGSGAPDSKPATISRSEFDQAVAARQAAKEQARALQAQLDEIKAAEAQRARKEAEEQGRFKDLADAAEAKAAEFEAKHTAATQRLEALTARHRATVESRLQALPEATRQTLTERLGDRDRERTRGIARAHLPDDVPGAVRIQESGHSVTGSRLTQRQL